MTTETTQKIELFATKPTAINVRIHHVTMRSTMKPDSLTPRKDFNLTG